MSVGPFNAWLGRAYVAALIVHGVIIVVFLGAAFLSVGGGTGIADSARGGLALVLTILVAGILPSLPSAIALLSWWLCRRRGWQPSAGHKSLTAAAAALLLVFFIFSVAFLS